MATQRKEGARLNSPDIIWVQLSSQRQQQAVRLIAYMALKLMMAPIDNPLTKEGENVPTAPFTQDQN